MEDDKFGVYQEIRSFIETEMDKAEFTDSDRKELIEMLNQDIPDIILNEDIPKNEEE